MVKITSISMPDWIYDTYIYGYNGNKSEYIAKLIIVGTNALITDDKKSQTLLINLKKENQSLLQQNQILNIKIGKVKQELENMKKEKEDPYFGLPEHVKRRKIMGEENRRMIKEREEHEVW